MTIDRAAKTAKKRLEMATRACPVEFYSLCYFICLTSCASIWVPYGTDLLFDLLVKNSVPQKVTLIKSTAFLEETSSGCSN